MSGAQSEGIKYPGTPIVSLGGPCPELGFPHVQTSLLLGPHHIDSPIHHKQLDKDIDARCGSGETQFRLSLEFMAPRASGEGLDMVCWCGVSITSRDVGQS